MIYALSKAIGDLLAAQGCPFKVVYGPERAGAFVNETRIVVERNRLGRDELAAPPSRPLNPKMIGIRWLACTATIYAQSSTPGANVWDHERIADQLVDLFTIALRKAVLSSTHRYTIASANFLPVEELQMLGIEQWPGVVYQLAFTVDRAVDDLPWSGEPAQEVTLGSNGLGLGLDLNASGQTSTDPSVPSAKVDL